MKYVDPKTLKKGDIILIETVVTREEDRDTGVHVKYIGPLVSTLKVHSVLERPIKPGDKVKSVGMVWTVEAILSTGGWAVVSEQGHEGTISLNSQGSYNRV